MLASAVVIGLLTWLNVRERRPEIGLLRALGKGTASIAGLFLVKAAMLGLMGGLVGCGLGYAVALAVGQSMEISQQWFQPNLILLAITIAGAPLIAADCQLFTDAGCGFAGSGGGVDGSLRS